MQGWLLLDSRGGGWPCFQALWPCGQLAASALPHCPPCSIHRGHCEVGDDSLRTALVKTEVAVGAIWLEICASGALSALSEPRAGVASSRSLARPVWCLTEP